MFSAEHFASLLTKTFNNPNDEERRKGELIITELINTKPNEFVSLTADVLQNRGANTNTRRLACTAFLQTFKMDRAAPGSPIWQALDPAVRLKMKETTFPLLIEDNEQIRKFAGTMMALIFVMDLTMPVRQFEDILPSICANIGHQIKSYGAVAIHGLSQVCQELTPARMKLMPQAEQDVLLGGIATAMKIKDENATTTVISTGKAMPAMALKFESPDFLTFMLQHLLEFLDFGRERGDLDLVHETVNCLGQVVKHAYYRMAPYYEVTFRKILDLEPIKEKTVRNATCEFFFKCLKFEERKQTDYFKGIWGELLQNCLQRLYEAVSFEADRLDETFEQLENISRLMNAINKIFFSESFPSLAAFVDERLKSQDPKELVVAVITLESVIDIPNQLVKADELCKVFQTVFTLTRQNQYMLLKIAALTCTDRMLVLYLGVLYAEKTDEAVVADLLELVTRRDDTELGVQIKLQACHMLETIAEQSKKHPEFLARLQQRVLVIMGTLFQVFSFTSDITAADSIFATIFCYLEHVLTNDQMNQFFPLLFDMMNQLQDQYHGANKEIFLESVVINMNVILCKLHNNMAPVTLNVADPWAYLGEVLKAVARLYEGTGRKMIECITLMTTIICSNPAVFRGSVIEFFDRFVKANLSTVDDVGAMQAAVLAFNFLIKVYPTELGQQMKDFGVYVFTIIGGEIPKELKTPIYYFISDIMISQPEVVRPYAPAVMGMNRRALETILNVFRNDAWDEQLVDFCAQFRDVLIENLFCYIHGLCNLNDPSVLGALEAHFLPIQEVFKGFLDESIQVPLPPDYHKQVFFFETDCMIRLAIKDKVDLQLVAFCYDHIDRHDPDWDTIRDRMENIRSTR